MTGQRQQLLATARAAQTAEDWAAAAAAWREAIEHQPASAHPRWYLQLGRALEAIDEKAEAEAAYRECLSRDPGEENARIRLSRLLMTRSRRREGLSSTGDEIVALALGGDDAPGAALRKASLLVRMSEIRQAREIVGRQVRSVTGLADAELAQRLLPQVFDGVARVPHLQALRTAVARIAGDASETARLARLRAALSFAVADYDAFATQVDKDAAVLTALPDWPLIKRIRQRVLAPVGEVVAEPKVFGIGLPKTGTTSLGRALGLLGYGNGDFVNPLTFEKLGTRDYFFLDSATDGPRFEFESLYYTYPNARFILTVRPFADWQTSLDDHLRRQSLIGADWRLRDTGLGDQRRGLAHALAAYADLFNAGSPRSAYDSFAARVAHFFSDKPAGKVLTLDIFAGQGWPDLCGFLDRPQPDLPFPWENKHPAAENDGEPATGQASAPGARRQRN